MAKVGILGTTTWGTTLAITLARGNVAVLLLARDEKEASLLNHQKENARFVPGVKFPDNLTVTSLPENVTVGVDMTLIAVPSRSFRENLQTIEPFSNAHSLIVSATKGLEVGTSKRMTQILKEELGLNDVCVLSGPNLASEIIQNKPSSAVVASSSNDVAVLVQSILNSNNFRVYTTDDVIGVELGGALKNIIALGSGVCDGLGFGNNAKAAFITRGLAEISRLAVASGANPLTLAGLSGMGDLIATCSSTLSRNHFVGVQLSRGMNLDEITEKMDNVAEGVDTTLAAIRLADDLRVDMPIANTAYDIMFRGLSVEKAVSDLLERVPRGERLD